MGRYLVVIFLPFLTLQTSLGPQPILFDQEKDRDQANSHKNSDKLERYCLHNDLSSEERNRMLGEMREFLWEHWKVRRAGSLSAVFYTIEGDPTFSTFFVEQDRKRRWRIRVHSESTRSFGLRKRQRPRREVVEETYEIVERVEDLSSQDPATATPLPESERRSPETYKLRMKSAIVRAGQRPVIIL